MLIKDLKEILDTLDSRWDNKPINVVITDNYTAYEVDYIEDDPDEICLDIGIHTQEIK